MNIHATLKRHKDGAEIYFDYATKQWHGDKRLALITNGLYPWAHFGAGVSGVGYCQLVAEQMECEVVSLNIPEQKLKYGETP